MLRLFRGAKAFGGATNALDSTFTTLGSVVRAYCHLQDWALKHYGTTLLHLWAGRVSTPTMQAVTKVHPNNAVMEMKACAIPLASETVEASAGVRAAPGRAGEGNNGAEVGGSGSGGGRIGDTNVYPPS